MKTTTIKTNGTTITAIDEKTFNSYSIYRNDDRQIGKIGIFLDSQNGDKVLLEITDIKEINKFISLACSIVRA